MSEQTNVRVGYPPLQVRTAIGREMGDALSRFDALLSPAAPTAAYKVRRTPLLILFSG